MERNEIIKALECISRTEDVLCEGCSYRKYDGLACHRIGAKNALALIKELTDENERLSQSLANSKSILANSKADTVRKMQERLKARYKLPTSNEAYTITPFHLHEFIDQIAKEMLGV